MKGKTVFHSAWKRKQWLVPYLFSRLFKGDDLRYLQGPKHILFLFVDHFEPGHGGADQGRQLERVKQWRQCYPEIVRPFQDCEGNNPRHTWFHLGEESEHLRLLSELCFQGLGEIELHLHHGAKDHIPEHWKQSSQEGLGHYIEAQKKFFADYGALITGDRDPQNVFGFIHGMFALDNSLPDYCGVPGELQLLRDHGCYADFTFPAPGKSQPPLINSLYYPTGDPKEGSSYFKGEKIKVGSTPRNEVLIIQGPLGLVWQGLKPHVEDGHLDWQQLPNRERILFWISRGVHVLGRPEWIFVKVYTHGAMERNIQELLGKPMERLHQELRKICGEGSPYQLHYVTAREAFNIAMAAMAGKAGDPGKFRNYRIPPYANTLINCNRPYQLKEYTPQAWSLQFLEPKEVLLKVKGDIGTEIKAEFLEELSFFRESPMGSISLKAIGKGRIEGKMNHLKDSRLFLLPEGQEGECKLFPLSTDFCLAFTGSFSSEGAFRVRLGLIQ